MKAKKSASPAWRGGPKHNGYTTSFPGIDRDMNHVRGTLAADGLQLPIDFLEPEGVGDRLLQREAMRGKLLQGQLARLIGVATGALELRVFLGHPVDREIRESRHFVALDDQDARFALQGGDAEQHGRRTGARRAVDGDVDAFRYDLTDSRRRVFLLHVDGVVGAESLGDFQALGIFAGAGDDDAVRACLLAGDDLRQALLAGALDQHDRAVTDTGLIQRPLDAVRERRGDTGKLGGHVVRDLVHHRIPRGIEIVRKAAPKVRLVIGRGVAVTDRVGIGVPIRGFAVPVFALMAPFAGHVRQIMFEQNAVAFLHAFARQPFTARFRDHAHIFVAHDHVFDLLGVILDVAAADAGDLDFDQSRLIIDLRHVELAVHSLVQAHLYGRRNL